MPALTANAIKALKKGSLADSKVRGLAIRHRDGRRVWSYRYTLDGRRSRITIGAFPEIGLADARRLAADLARRIAAGEDPALDRDARRAEMTVNELIDRALAEHWEVRSKPSTIKAVRQTLDMHVRPPLGRMRVSSITRKRVAMLHQKVGKTKPGAANRMLSYLAKAYSLAILWEVATVHPCKGIQRFKERRIERYLTDVEIARLKVATDELHAEGMYPPALALPWWLILTGMRSGEALGMRWDDVNAETGLVHLPDSKVGERTVPISPEAFAMIDQLERVGPWVFPKETDPLENIKSPWSWWLQIRERAGITDVRLHDLRHSHATLLLRAGIHLSVIQSILGHSTITTTQRYLHSQRDQEHEALGAVAKLLGD